MLRDLFAHKGRSAVILGAALSCAAQCHAAAFVHLSRPSVDFGPLGLSTMSSVQPVFVTNTGDSPLTISAVTLGGPQPGDFAIAGTCAPPITIAPGGQCRIDTTATLLGFVPQTRIATVNLASNATLPSATFSLLGVVVGDITSGMVPSPPWIDFGNQIVGTSAAHQPLMLHNAESTTEVIEGVVLDGGDAQDFTVTSDCVGQTSGHGSTCTATIGFTPSAAGPRSTQLEIDYHPTAVPTLHFNRFYSITGVGTNSGSPATLNIDQQGLTGSWYEPATSGQGFEVEVFPDLVSPGTGFVQVSWFTYDSVTGGAEHQRWYTAQGQVASGQPNAALTVLQNTGGNFNAPPMTNAQQVGTATLSFDSCTSGQLIYTFTDGTGRTGTIPLTRLTQNATCSTTAPHPTNADFALSGNWFAPATSGQGFTVEVNANSSTAFAAWYTYAPSGAGAGAAGQRWYTAQGTFTPGARSIPVQINETTGGMFDTPTPAGQKTVPVGSGTLAFQSCAAATFSYNFTGGSSSGLSGTINLIRVGPVPPGCSL